MSCNNPCSPKTPKQYAFGIYPHCGEICLPIDVDQEGVYYLEYIDSGIKDVIPVEAVEGKLCFNAQCLNECKEICFQILQPDQTYFELTEDENKWDEFKLETRITKINNKEINTQGDTFEEIGKKPDCLNNEC